MVAQNAVDRHSAKISWDRSTPTLFATIEGCKRRFILDTGSSISLIQPGIISEVVQATDLIPFGVTGDKLEIKGEQEVVFAVNKVQYKHQFLVCKLPSKPSKHAGILGVDFLLAYKAQLNLEKEEIQLIDSWEVRNVIAKGLINPSALTVFSDSDDQQDKRNLEVLSTASKTIDKKTEQLIRKPSINTGKEISYIVKSIGTTKLQPRVRQIVMGKLEVKKGSKLPELLCIEPADSV